MNCVFCDVPVTDPEYARVVYQENYPHIPIGPYCPDCFPKVRVCSGCQVPYIADQGITYHSNGQWFCDSCRETLVYCTNCSLLTHKHVEGTTLCSDCFFENQFICSCCSGSKSIDLKVEDPETVARYPELFQVFPILCKDCFSVESKKYVARKIKSCPHCSKNFPYSHDYEVYCPTCWDSFNRCFECKSKGPNVKVWNLESGDLGHICPDCHKKLKYYTCKSCAFEVKTQGIKKDPFGKIDKVCHTCSISGEYCSGCFKLRSQQSIDSAGYCSSCRTTYLRNPERSGDVKNYSFKPTPFFNHLKGDKDMIFFGFENEVSYGTSDHSSDNKREAIRNFGRHFSITDLYLKSDGSIDGYGFEVVSQPMSLNYFHNLPLDRLFTGGEIKSKSCGLHVHVSRNSFGGDVHIYKVLDFVYNNKAFNNLIAGRTQNTYCAGLNCKVSEAVAKGKEKERYKKVNLSGLETIEFRMFAGCIDDFELSYRIEYVHALVTWAKNTTIKNNGVPDFVSFIKENQKNYRNLYNFLKVERRIK